MDNEENTKHVGESSGISVENEVPPEIKNENKEKGSKNKKPLIIVFAVLFLLISVALTYFFLDNNSDNGDDLSNENSNNQDNNQIVVCSKDGVEYEVGEIVVDSEKCEICTCYKVDLSISNNGNFLCTPDEKCQSAKDNKNFFDNKVFYINSRGYSGEEYDENQSASDYEIFMFDIDTKQKKQLTFMNKDKTLQSYYLYTIKGFDSESNLLITRGLYDQVGDKQDIVKLNIETLKWEIMKGLTGLPYNVTDFSLLSDGSLAYLQFALQPIKQGEEESYNMEVVNYLVEQKNKIYTKTGFALYGRGGMMGDMISLSFAPDSKHYSIKQTIYTLEDNTSGPIWINNFSGTEIATLDGTEPVWVDNNRIVYLKSDKSSSPKIEINEYNIENKKDEKVVSLETTPYGLSSHNQKVVFWSNSEEESYLLDVNEKKVSSIGKGYFYPMWLNDSTLILRQSVDCSEAYELEQYSVDCPPNEYGEYSFALKQDTIWTYNIETKKMIEFKIANNGESIGANRTYLSFK